MNKNISSKEKEFSALSYVWIFSILVYYSPESKSDFVYHHSKQGVFLCILLTFTLFLPGIFFYFNIFPLFLMVLGIIEAMLGKKYFLPIIGPLIFNKSINQDHKNFFYYWIKKLKKNQNKYKFINRSQWEKEIINLEQIFLEHAKNLKTEKTKTETLVFLNEVYAKFTVINKDSIIIWYLEDKVFLPSQIEFEDFYGKKFNKTEKEELIQFLKCIFSEKIIKNY
jgi:uncharacterized membrane protein